MIGAAVTLIGLLLLWQFAHRALKVLAKEPEKVDLAPVWERFMEFNGNYLQVKNLVSGLELRLSKLEGENDGIKKLAEDTKKLISGANIALGFRAPQRRKDA